MQGTVDIFVDDDDDDADDDDDDDDGDGDGGGGDQFVKGVAAWTLTT